MSAPNMSVSKGTEFDDKDIQIRPATKEDMKAVAEMIQELADFEKMPDGPKMSVADLERDGFERVPPAFQCLVAARTPGSPDTGTRDLAQTPGSGQSPVIVGYALYFPTYSTWKGRAVMLEDLYVRPDQRRRGLGKRLFNAVAKETSSNGGSRLDFHVLEWNPARSFYESKGAQNLTQDEQWCYYRLSGAALHSAAHHDSQDQATTKTN